MPVTYEQFIKREMHVWGEDYIYDLMDRGFKPVLLITEMGQTKWSWKMPLTTAPPSATVGRGGVAAFTPVFATNRASRG